MGEAGLNLYLGLSFLWCKSCLNSSTAACRMSLIVMASKCQHVHHHRRGLCKSAGTIDLLQINLCISTQNIKKNKNNKRHSTKKEKKQQHIGDRCHFFPSSCFYRYRLWSFLRLTFWMHNLVLPELSRMFKIWLLFDIKVIHVCCCSQSAYTVWFAFGLL